MYEKHVRADDRFGTFAITSIVYNLELNLHGGSHALGCTEVGSFEIPTPARLGSIVDATLDSLSKHIMLYSRHVYMFKVCRNRLGILGCEKHRFEIPSNLCLNRGIQFWLILSLSKDFGVQNYVPSWGTPDAYENEKIFTCHWGGLERSLTLTTLNPKPSPPD